MFQTGNALLDEVLESLPAIYRGPGGAVAVLQDGKALARHAWGYADLERHIPMTAATLMPMCSISKEFTCAAILTAIGDPTKLQPVLERHLPSMGEQRPTVVDLCNNQSGLRDYWALTVLCGAVPEGEFTPEDARTLLSRTTSTHFDPGSQYSYANGNFRLLANIVPEYTGRSLGDLVAESIFRPAGMKTAQWCTESRSFPGDAVGYEGSMATGFVPAVNRISLAGDSGVNACLDDMIAWEHFIDETRDDPDSIYRRISAPTFYVDGAPACYGFGLKKNRIHGIEVSGHGGALRGWSLQRRYAASKRISVVVMFNHQANSNEAANRIIEAALGFLPKPSPERQVDPVWYGNYLDRETKLSLSLTAFGNGRMKARFATLPDIMEVEADGIARSEAMTLERKSGGVIRLARSDENLFIELEKIDGEARRDIEGRFHSAELGSDLVCASSGGEIFVAFEGFLGKGAMQPIYAIGPDVWLMPNERAMDSNPPGDWTLVFERDDAGNVNRATIGCWLARKVVFDRQ